ncbi:hypothetical protein ACH4F6_15280 [Streptomyces sp. NPDC017936]|uniref:hypothetical protein n=1 Tax=Streptomyces sp. NPDC017936 TaxID=3365016 RepID=UPI0037B3A365
MSLTTPRTRPEADGRALPATHDAVREAARDHGVARALTLLHAATLPGLLPAGHGGHVLVPAAVEATSPSYDTPDGPRARRSGPHEEHLARLPLPDGDTLVALRIPGAGPGARGATGWAHGLVHLRLGLAERALREATGHLRGRSVQGTVMLHLPLVRALVADAACGLAEARALIREPDTDGAALSGAHRALDEAGRVCLHLLGATGFATGGPGDTIRASELLADTYAPPPPVPEGDRP